MLDRKIGRSKGRLKPLEERGCRIRFIENPMENLTKVDYGRGTELLGGSWIGLEQSVKLLLVFNNIHCK